MIVNLRHGMVAILAATLSCLSLDAEARLRNIDVTLEVEERDGVEVLVVTANSSRCKTLEEDLTEAQREQVDFGLEHLTEDDLDKLACIDVPRHPLDFYDINFRLDAEECVAGQGGYTLIDVRLARRRDEFGRAITTQMKLDFRDRGRQPKIESGDFSRRDREVITLRNNNRGRYVAFYQVRGRNCATGERIVLVDPPIKNGGRDNRRR